MQRQPQNEQPEYPLAELLKEAIRKARWRVKKPAKRSADFSPDLLADRGGQKFIFAIRRVAGSRRDWLIPMLSQAILQVRAAARESAEPVVPVAVVGAASISRKAAASVQAFAARYAPDIGIGVVDLRGFRRFTGHGLEVLNSPPPVRPPKYIRSKPLQPRYEPHLFSDLNQWMLKILLAADIPESMLTAPREEFTSGAQLSRAAGVSVMTASRLLRQLAKEGFLSDQQEQLRIARKDELLQSWVANSRQAPIREVPVRWVLRRGEEQLFRAVKAYSSRIDNESRHGLPRICIGLFAAADRLKLGFVRGAKPHIYLERLDQAALAGLGLSTENAEQAPDVYLRIPSNPEALFRGAVKCDGVPVADVLQIYLDVSANPARGKEQAGVIRRRALAPLFAEH